MALTVCVVYLLVLMLFDDRHRRVLAGLLVALIPEQLIWSATAAVEPSASLACVAALRRRMHFIRSRSTAALAAAVVSAAYAVQFRPESLLVLPVIGLLLWHHAREEFRRARLWWLGLLFVALVAAHVAHLFAVRNEGWGTAEARLSLALRRGEPAGERVVLPGRRALSGRLHAARPRRAVSAAGSPPSAWRCSRISCSSSRSISCSMPAATTTALTSAIRS